MLRTLPLAICAGLILMGLPTSLYADAMTACLKASTDGQTLRDEYKLLEAREQFIACARAECPSIVLKDCAMWLEEVHRELPTVVPSAKDGRGKDLVDVRLTVDGKPFATKLDGAAFPMNPGVHVFRFALPDGSALETQAVVNQGEKNQRIAVTFALPLVLPPTSPSPTPAASVDVSPGKGAFVPDTRPDVANPSSRIWKPVGWMLAGVGVVGLGVGVVFGLQKISKENDRNDVCPSRVDCTDPELAELRHLTDDARQAAALSVIGFVAGGAALVGGTVLVLATPAGGKTKGAAFDFRPWVGTNGAGASIGGMW